MDRAEKCAWQAIETLEAAGHQAYLVGGCVRDRLLARQIVDYDITTSARPEEVQILFAQTVPTGIRHGTISVLVGSLQYEVTTFRTDGEYTDGRRPSEVKFVRSLVEDLARRDLTINAMALGRDGILHDPFGGQRDLEQQRIRAVGDPRRRFEEDALRILRAIRFAAQLRFEIEERTLQAIAEEASSLQAISRERIREEWHKMLLTHPDLAIRLLLQTDTLRYIFFRPPADRALWQRAADWAARAPADLALRTFLLYSAIGLDQPRMEKNMQGLKLSSSLKRELREQISMQSSGSPAAWSDLQFRQLFFEYGHRAVWLRCLFHAVSQDANRLQAWSERVDHHRQQQPLWNLQDLAVTGQDLIRAGIPAGPALGRWLQRLAQLVLRDPAKNEQAVLLHQLQLWRAEETGDA